MKIARIMREGREEYGVLKEGLWYPQKINRNDLGIEDFLYNPINISLDLAIDLDQEDFTWLPPIARPGKILCIGRNYAEHSREQGKEPETNPLIFSKFVTSLTGHQTIIPYPNHTSNLDYEVELAVVIGKTCSKLSADDEVWDYIYGFTVANDLTARDVQKSEKQWTRGKGFDNSLPIGPWIKLLDKEKLPLNHQIWLKVDGEPRQESNTANMIFSIPYLIRYISQTITLEPGDLILTGTPEGVGYYMEPKGVLNIGQSISCGIEDIGELEFTIGEKTE